jgi:hypothetical protein
MGTLAPPRPEDAHLVTRTFPVEVRKGDDVLLGEAQPVSFIKIDVEGFELRALRGLRGAIERWRPLVVTEMQRDWLARAGTTRGEVFGFMAALGHAPFGLATRRRAARHRLALHAIAQSEVESAPFNDFAWLHPSALARASFGECIV